MSAIAELRIADATDAPAPIAVRPAIAPQVALARWRRARPVVSQVVARSTFLVLLFAGFLAGSATHLLLLGLAVAFAFGAVGSYLSVHLAIAHARRLHLRVADEVPLRQISYFAIAIVLTVAAPVVQPLIG